MAHPHLLFLVQVLNAKRKLEGTNPAHITVQEVRRNHYINQSSKFLSTVEALVSGDPSRNARLVMWRAAALSVCLNYPVKPSCARFLHLGEAIVRL